MHRGGREVAVEIDPEVLVEAVLEPEVVVLLGGFAAEDLEDGGLAVDVGGGAAGAS